MISTKIQKERRRSSRNITCDPARIVSTKTSLLNLPSPVALIKERSEVGERLVKFACHKPDARKVFIAGSFNDWDEKRTPLVKQKTGLWQTEIQLRPGAYEYRFVVDGVWQEDPMSACLKPNPFGGVNSVIIIKD